MKRVFLATALTLLASTAIFAAEPIAMTSAMSDEALMDEGQQVVVDNEYDQGRAKSAPGYKHDKNSTKWVFDKS